MSRFCLAVDSSQITQFLQCQESERLKYKENLQKKDIPRSKALDNGTIIHGLLERYYHKIAENRKPWDAYAYSIECLKSDSNTLGLDKEEVQFLQNRFMQYVIRYEQYDVQPLIKNKIPQIEIGFSIPIVDTSDYLFVLEGRIDLICTIDKQIYLMDHKSQSKYYNYYDYSIQFLNYVLASQINRLSVNYIGLQQTINDNTFRRDLFNYNSAIIRRWRDKLETIMFQMTSALITDRYDQNFSHCQSSYGLCPYTDICESLDPHIKNEMIRIKYRERDEWMPWREK